MWKNLRIAILLLILAAVALHQWLERHVTQSWQSTLWVGIFPLNADGSARTADYIATLTPRDFKDIEAFFAREAHRYGIQLEEPVHVELYPQGRELPPELSRGSGLLSVMWWSLKMRWYAAHASDFPGHPPARIRLFVLYHDPQTLDQVPDSHGMQKGLLGVVHAFADRTLAGSNNLVIAHELLHTVGASDKYAFTTGEPLYPIGFAAPAQEPLYPQEETEIMAGRRPVSPTEWEMPRSLAHVVVGPATALEIRWQH
ncbi:MAG: hypothetical protein JOZ67_12025 [Gammaproteobacteria bacterium]|nr:hypothetical protein [Gammaproteobacteria bacterium]MBV9698421.1 hypothetical protein [Gammaproteobacteria bacterium]